ncbi:MAG: M12 family metallo-peptidase [Planctomycetota bacterium]|jgi:hypothetical protein
MRHAATLAAMVAVLVAAVGPALVQAVATNRGATVTANGEVVAQAAVRPWSRVEGSWEGKHPQASDEWRPGTTGEEVIRSWLIRVDLEELGGLAEGQGVVLDLFDDLSVRGLVERRRERGDDRFNLSGRIEGEVTRSFSLAVNGNALAGVVLLGEFGTYRIRFGPAGMHILQQIDSGGMLRCRSEEGGLRPSQARTGGGSADLGEDCDDGSVIDVLVVYTYAAQVAAGGVAAIEAEIDLMVEYNAVSYEDSLVETVWNLVFVWQLDPEEDPTLWELTDPNDGVADGVHTLRDAYGADQVALIVDGGGGVANGLWNLDPESEALAFCVNGRDSAPLVLSHEIGHNMGCCHARGDGGGCPAGGGLLFPYSNGHRFIGDSGTQWHTVMAYPPGTPIQRFSNPDLLFDGQPTGVPEGDPESADNVQTINLSAYTVSNWRCNDGICEGLDLPSDGPDCDGNGVPDGCDIALGWSPDANENGVPDQCDTPGDSDGDGDVDLFDFAAFAECVTGPGGQVQVPVCITFDFDSDTDVDLDDYAAFQFAFGTSP